jgi:hypothetical protein
MAAMISLVAAIRKMSWQQNFLIDGTGWPLPGV